MKPPPNRIRTQRSVLSPSLFDPPPKKAPLEPEVAYNSLKIKPKAEECHHDVIARILFLYAKLNPGVRYVQGMNEILAPIYYTFARDPEVDFRQNAEADAFFCFSTIMSELRDRFIKSLDYSETGIFTVVEGLDKLLKKVEPEIWQHLTALQIDPRFYAFRWLTLLLSQEFELPEVLRLWDSLFADERRFQFLNYVCVAMIKCMKQELLRGDFAENLSLLQVRPAFFFFLFFPTSCWLVAFFSFFFFLSCCSCNAELLCACLFSISRFWFRIL